MSFSPSSERLAHGHGIGAPVVYLALALFILSWFTYAVFDALKDRPSIDKGCQEMLCVS